MTVTITQDIRDIGNVPDNVTVRFGSPVARGVGSSLITTKWTSFTAVAGILTAVVEPGPAKVMIRHVGTFDVTIPNTDSDLWSLIAAAVGIPPTTPADMVTQAVNAYLTVHPPAKGDKGDKGDQGDPVDGVTVDGSGAFQFYVNGSQIGTPLAVAIDGGTAASSASSSGLATLDGGTP